MYIILNSLQYRNANVTMSNVRNNYCFTSALLSLSRSKYLHTFMLMLMNDEQGQKTIMHARRTT